MTPALQLLVFVGAIAGLVAFGFYRDKREHTSQPETRQPSIYSPETRDDKDPRQGAAMSRLG
jgi:hypothetical protein